MVFALAGIGFVAGVLLSFAFDSTVFGAGPISLAFIGALCGWALNKAFTAQVTKQLEPLQNQLKEVSNSLDLAHRLIAKLKAQMQAGLPAPSVPSALMSTLTPATDATHVSSAAATISTVAQKQAQENVEAPTTVVANTSTNKLESVLASKGQTATTPVPAPAKIETVSFPLEPSTPSEPNVIEQGLVALQKWFFGGNIILRVGMIILFIGLAFLARQAALKGYFPPELRLAIVGLVGIAAISFGYIKRLQKPTFALPLQGFGVATLYLAVFAAFKLFNLLPQLGAFGLMVAICVLGVALALLQNSAALAFASFAGGFATPLLLSDGSGNHVGLFAYYLLLNIGILLVAYKRSWRALNVLGFVATFGVALTWGLLKFSPDNYTTTQPFLIAFFLVYLLTAIFYAQKSPTKYGNTVDSMLVFGNPIITFGLQYGLTKEMPLGAGLSALGMSATHIVGAFVVSKRDRKNNQMLMETFLAIGIGFLTLAIPLALDARWTSAIWAVEGLAAFWVGMRQRRWMLRVFGLALQAVAAIMYIGHHSDAYDYAKALFHPHVFGALLLAISAFVLARWLRSIQPIHQDEGKKHSHEIESSLSSPLYLYGFVWTCFALAGQVNQLFRVNVISTEQTASFVLMFVLLAALFVSLWFGRKAKWATPTFLSKLSLPVLIVGFVFQLTTSEGPTGNWGWISWLALFGIHWFFLKQYDRDLNNDSIALPISAADHQSYIGFIHASSVWLFTAFLAHCLYRAIDKAQLWGTSWASVTLLVAAILVVFCLTAIATKLAKTGKTYADASPGTEQSGGRWPFNRYARSYAWIAVVPMIPLLFIGTTLAAFVSRGQSNPLPYVPLLNPTELTIALSLGTLLFWRQRILRSPFNISPSSRLLVQRPMFMAVAALAFIAINTVWFRIAHHYLNVSWNLSSMLESFVVQAGLSILWSTLALALMVWAHRQIRRPVWIVGATLLGLVVVKLLLIDMSNRGGTERIITFIAVGLLMLLVGWFAPMPPAAKANSQQAPTSP